MSDGHESEVDQLLKKAALAADFRRIGHLSKGIKPDRPTKRRAEAWRSFIRRRIEDGMTNSEVSAEIEVRTGLAHISEGDFQQAERNARRCTVDDLYAMAWATIEAERTGGHR